MHQCRMSSSVCIYFCNKDVLKNVKNKIKIKIKTKQKLVVRSTENSYFINGAAHSSQEMRESNRGFPSHVSPLSSYKTTLKQ